MPLEAREVCRMCGEEVIPEKMGIIACCNCLPKTGKVDFKNSQERANYYKNVARVQREKKLPKICPRCEGPFLDSRSWVVRGDGLIVCRGCNHRINLLKGVRMEAAFDKAFTIKLKTRYVVNGAALREARKKLRVTMRGVAELCGWGISYLNELECGNTLEISEESFFKLLKTFEILKEIPDYDAEIAALKIKQKQLKKKYLAESKERARAELKKIQAKQKVAKKEFGRAIGAKDRDLFI